MTQKNSFVLRTSYGEIFNEMSDKQAGMLIKAICDYVATGDEPAGFSDVELKMAFKFIKQDIDYDTQKYANLCQKRAEAGKAGGRPATTLKKQNKQMLSRKANGLQEKPVKHNDVVVDVVGDVVVEGEGDLNDLTEPGGSDAAQNDLAGSVEPFLEEAVDVEPLSPTSTLGEIDPDAGTFRAKPKTDIQRFGVWYVKTYWPELYQTAGAKATGAWFKRNGKALSEVLNLADGDVCLAVAVTSATEAQMADFEKRKGQPVQWGLEAVARNFADNFKTAQELLQAGFIPKEVMAYAQK